MLKRTSNPVRFPRSKHPHSRQRSNGVYKSKPSGTLVIAPDAPCKTIRKQLKFCDVSLRWALRRWQTCLFSFHTPYAGRDLCDCFVRRSAKEISTIHQRLDSSPCFKLKRWHHKIFIHFSIPSKTLPAPKLNTDLHWNYIA